jgi:GNAT superfamily N-acetyltransferase
MRNIVIRRGTVQDAERISKLIAELAEEFIVNEFTAEGRLHFLADHSPAKVEERLQVDFRFYLAEDVHELVAVGAMRSNTHLYYLFVAKPYQRRGLARYLWSLMKAESLALGQPDKFTVNASNYAVHAYEKLGFRQSQPPKELNGVIYNPMEFVVDG